MAKSKKSVTKNKRNRNKQPISNAERVRMCRERKKLKAALQQLLTEELNNSSKSGDLSILSSPSPSATPSSLKTDLRDWANEHRITKRALDGLLGILNANGIISVPKNHRTLLNTPVNIEITKIAGGLFWYNGLENSIKRIFSTLDRNVTISLKVNVDGLPLYKSSKMQFWPILASIHGMCVLFVLNRWKEKCLENFNFIESRMLFIMSKTFFSSNYSTKYTQKYQN